MKVAGASTFLSSVASTALITSGGVLTGTSVATIKMARRTGEVEFFRFIPVVTNKKTKPAGDAAAPPTAGEHSDIQKTLDFDVKKQSGLLIISISGWITSKDGTGKQLTSTDSVPRTSQESASRASSSTPTRPRAESRASGTSQDPSTPTSEKAPKNMADAQQDLYEILANGQHDLILPFSGLSPINGPHYALCFSPDTLRSLGDALKMLASEVISFSTTQLLQQTILSGVLSALTWPMWLVKLGYLVVCCYYTLFTICSFLISSTRTIRGPLVSSVPKRRAKSSRTPYAPTSNKTNPSPSSATVSVPESSGTVSSISPKKADWTWSRMPSFLVHPS